jgi:hypothetical protein
MATKFQKRLAVFAGLVLLAVTLLAVVAATAQAAALGGSQIAGARAHLDVLEHQSAAPSAIAAARAHLDLLEHQYGADVQYLQVVAPAATTTTNGPVYIGLGVAIAALATLVLGLVVWRRRSRREAPVVVEASARFESPETRRKAA